MKTEINRKTYDTENAKALAIDICLWYHILATQIEYQTRLEGVFLLSAKMHAPLLHSLRVFEGFV